MIRVGMHRSAALACAFLVAAAPAAAQSAPQVSVAARRDAVPRYSIEDFLATTRYAGASWSPDGTTLLYSAWNQGGEGMITVPADSPTDVTVLSDVDGWGVGDDYSHR
ncbi:MAG TPA: hypothetical protein VFY16_09385, partial [Gemmatimonadaceae bacterium]|nr:hypothetical protein [Gemmatimonadaceae bacterium]